MPASGGARTMHPSPDRRGRRGGRTNLREETHDRPRSPRPICSPKSSSPASTNGPRCTTGSTGSSRRTSTSSATGATSTRRCPTAFGGGGLSFAEVQALQARLAYVAPATALAVNMHFYWTGVAADLSAAGDPSCEWMLRASVDGAVFAAGHGEAGNDIPLLMSSSAAERVDGGWEITGHKIFGSLSPVWTYLGSTRSTPATPPAHASCTRSCRATPSATASSRRGTCSACARPRATTRSSTTRSSPTSTSRSCAPPASAARACSRSRSSRGDCSASRRCTARSRSARTTRRYAACIAALRSR